jgi:hypothetical protein
MSTSSRLARQTAEKLIGSRAALQRTPALLGFDGFVDHIYHAVETRKSPTEFTRIKTLKAFGQRITAAAGKSTNIEIVLQSTRLGGNGPLMAFAMSSLGVPVNYIGMTGYPQVHPVFAEFAKRATVSGIGEPAQTDAIEFEDGKLLIGKLQNVNEVQYENIKKRVPKLLKNWEAARFIGLVNWTMLPHMTAIWKKIQAEMSPKDNNSPKQFFFDLADPEKRGNAELEAALKILAKFQEHYEVTLGLNEKEAGQVCTALGVRAVGKGEKLIMSQAQKIREKLGVHTVVIHPLTYAVAADASGPPVSVQGPFTKNPKISTGGGDHFNAGFAIGRLLGCDAAQALQLGVATSGFYVRQATPPSREQLVRFLQTL